VTASTPSRSSLATATAPTRSTQRRAGIVKSIDGGYGTVINASAWHHEEGNSYTYDGGQCVAVCGYQSSGDERSSPTS
jgi:hypothetical protein